MPPCNNYAKYTLPMITHAYGEHGDVGMGLAYIRVTYQPLYKETIMSYDPSDFGCCDEHIPYEELDGIDLINHDMELSEGFKDEVLELDDEEDIPY